MASPAKYVPNYSFTGYQTQNPSDPLPAPQLDNELASVASSLGATIDGLGDVRRSDGKLANQSVGPDQLSAALTIGFTNRGSWTSGTSYGAGDGVSKGTSFYSARVANVAASGNAPDVDTTTWQFLFVLSSSTSPPNGSVTEAMLDPTLDAALARLASPTLTGTPTAPTAAPGTNTLQLATTAFVTAAFTALANGVSGAYDTLAEIAADLVTRWNASVVGAFPSKTPVDADVFAGLDSVSSYAGVVFTFSQVKTAIKTYLDSVATTLTNKKLSDSTSFFSNVTDATKLLVFQLSGLTTGTTRTVTWPDKNGTVAMTSDVPAAGQPIPTSSTFAVGVLVCGCENESGGSIADGSTVAGSSLHQNGGAGNAQSGTWKNVSGNTVANNGSGNFVRTA